MQIEYIIVQAGGSGTRLGRLTHNKPKSLVAVKNRPILFHMFERFPRASFIIIGDYKYDILERYLRTFAKVDYKLVNTEKKGNAAGICKALSLLPSGVPFMIVWSDVLLSADLHFDGLLDGNYIGLTSQFPCSWCMKDGALQKESDGKQGVAGVFLFREKSVLDNLPVEGSLMGWINDTGIELTPFDILDSREVGTIEAITAIDSGENRCRPYNSLKFHDNLVIKSALTDEGQKLIDKEVVWYRAMIEYGFPNIPGIHKFNPLTMSRINGKNIFEEQLSRDAKRETVLALVNTLDQMHSYDSCPADLESLNIEYYEKTLARLDSVRNAIPLTDDKIITINGRKCRNPLFFRVGFKKMVEERLFDTIYRPIHGDCTLTNTMKDSTNNIYFIDARGYFGKNEVFGDVYYDWAKLFYSISGNFDQFNIKNFSLEIGENEINYDIQSNGWEFLTDYYLSLIDCNYEKIKLIHAIIWLSLASHCWEDFDSLCTAFYNGVSLLEDCW